MLQDIHSQYSGDDSKVKVISAAKDFPIDTTDSGKHDIEMGKENFSVIKSFSEDQKQKLKELFGMKDLKDIHPSDLVGRTYLQPEYNSDGTRSCCEIVQALKEHEEELSKDKSCQRFLVSVNNRE